MSKSIPVRRCRYPTDIPSLAKYILSDNDCKSIGVLTGAGISVASGIPDFRSTGGMYDTLRPELITATPRERKLMESDPTDVVSWNIFHANQFPYLEVRRPFILGTQQQQWKATLGHWFFDLLEQKTTKLTRLYTQNIDGLFYQLANLPPEKLVDVHGTIANVTCELCNHPIPLTDFCDKVRKNIKDIYNIDADAPKESTHILCEKCNQPTVKPTTVLFGRSLPQEFFELSEQDMPKLDLLIIAGTSLVVSPANTLVFLASKDAARVLINREPAGETLGLDCSKEASESESHRDLFLQGDCDNVLLELTKELGWMDDLLKLRNKLPPASASLLSNS
ncbi:hypothetical protein ACA910_022157 [Epithemia clementina (nom. ined.)]